MIEYLYMKKIQIGIVGYGNLGKAAETAIAESRDMQVAAVFTRRDPATVKSTAKCVKFDKINDYAGKIDVMLLCGGSASDILDQAPEIIKNFNTADSFDTHAKIQGHYEHMDKLAKQSGRTAVISAGWDPGLFSLNRVVFDSVLSGGIINTFWGKGVSQGHGDAIRKVAGVKYAVQYTIPKTAAINSAKSPAGATLTARDKHLRECFVVAESGADKQKIQNEIITMPNYFADYDTAVHFITEAQFLKNHTKMPHGGKVINYKNTQSGDFAMEFSIELASNPYFTAKVLVCYLRACHRLFTEKKYGAFTVLDIPPSYLSEKNRKDLYKFI